MPFGTYLSKNRVLICLRASNTLVLCGSSHPEVVCKKGVLSNFAKFTGKHLCQSLFLNKLQASGLRPATLLKKRICHSCFPVTFAKFLGTGIDFAYQRAF